MELREWSLSSLGMFQCSGGLYVWVLYLLPSCTQAIQREVVQSTDRVKLIVGDAVIVPDCESADVNVAVFISIVG